MYKKDNPVTRLCTSDVDNIWIRGRNLCDELIGKLSFTDMIVFHFLGTEPTALQRAAVDAVLAWTTGSLDRHRMADRLLELTGAYAVLANGGQRVPLSPVACVLDAEGKLVWRGENDSYSGPPDASQIERLEDWFIGLLPIDSEM